MADASQPTPLPVIPIAGTGPQPPPKDFWPAGRFFMMRIDAHLPARCIKCNRETQTYIRKRLYWMESQKGGFEEKIPFAGWIFALVRWFRELRTLKAPLVRLPICKFHRRVSRILTAIALLAFPASLCVLFTPWDDLYQILVPMGGFAVSAIAWVIPRPVKPTHVGAGYVTIAGMGSEFLRSTSEPEIAPICKQ